MATVVHACSVGTIGLGVAGGHRDGHVVRIVPVDEDHPYTLPIGEVDGVVRDRIRDLQILALRARKQAFRGLRREVGLPPSPRSFRLLELLPEPIWVWLPTSQLRSGKAHAGILALVGLRRCRRR